MYAPDLQGNLLKMNPSTLQIANAKIYYLQTAGVRSEKNLFAGWSHMLMYDKTCGEDR